jgi:peptidoglycan/LPS O-acetylase OafA/YrhL
MNVVAQLAHYMSQRRSVVVASALAFSLTLVLAMLSYRFIEIPAQRLKQHLKYGPVKENSSSPKLREEILVGTGA